MFDFHSDSPSHLARNSQVPPPTLVVLRGNSGSGKSTVATAIRQARDRRDLAIVPQDVVRRQILREHDVPGAANIELLNAIVRWCLGRGYHVVLEGILAADRYGEMLEVLRGDHPASSHWFYLDIPFEETERRHQTRPQRDDFTAAQMAEWYQARDLLPGGHEIVIDQTSSLTSTVDLIMTRSGLSENGTPSGQTLNGTTVEGDGRSTRGWV